MLGHVRLLVSLIEGVAIRRQEILDLLRGSMRQHSIARRRKSDYVLAFVNQHPP